MSSTQPSLPTGWLAPPPGLLPPNGPIKIEPVPIAISATLTFVVAVILVLSLMRKGKDVFLEDRILHSPGSTNTASPAEAPIIQQPGPTFTNPIERRPVHQQAPKAIARLGMDGPNWQHDDLGAEVVEGPPAQPQKQYYDATYDSGDEALHDVGRNSKYWPPPRSDVSDEFDKEAIMRHYASRPQSYENSSIRRTPYGIASTTRLGDPY